MERLVIRTPARLHFGLIDMNGEIGRIDGGVGLALEAPSTTIEVRKSDRVLIECKDDPETEERLLLTTRTICGHFQFPGAEVRILERPIPHVGLGSATQTLVGAAQAVCKLYGTERPSIELAGLVGRGGTSGIGIGAIQSGGFVVDGGHRFLRDQRSKFGYLPSSASSEVKPPPILLQNDFPDWDILIAIPLGEGASGLREVTLFRVVCPIPLEDVQRMCHILLMQMLPAVIEADLDVFSEAMGEFQTLGFKVFEYRAQTQLVMDCLEFLQNQGGKGVGMSSWGPALFAFGEDLSGLHQRTQSWLDERGGGEAILTKVNNVGIVQEED